MQAGVTGSIWTIAQIVEEALAPTNRWAPALLALCLLAGASIPILLALQGHREDATRIVLALVEAIGLLAEAAISQR
ncbi:MAG: hypothetical protein HUU21_00560 [Polyangiaceae bacterium]|nr:hypothetical protein [Polyangiaceae bacterium]